MDKAPYIIGSPEEWRRFAEDHPVFMQRLPKLRSTFNKIIARQAEGQMPVDRVLMTLGWICAHTFEEILVLCGNGLGIGGLKLLRGLFENAVTMQYLSAFPEEVQKFFDYNAIHTGKYFSHTEKDFDLKNTIAAEQIEEIKKAKKEAEVRFKEPICETCGTTNTQMSWFAGGLLSMAQRARKKLGLKKDEGLDGLYGMCYFMPTMHTHTTFFTFPQWIEFSDEGMEWKVDAERDHVDHALGGAHVVMMHVLKTHNDYYKLELDEELGERQEDLLASWRKNS